MADWIDGWGGVPTGAPLFVHAAMLCYVAGLVLRAQIALRLFLLMGSGFYVAYYATIAEAPLWDAIYASLTIGTATTIGLARLLMDPLEILVPARDRAVFERMDAIAPGIMPPGQFRRLMRIAERRTAPEDFVVTALDHSPPELVLVLSGTARVEWGADVERRPHPRFIGVIAFVRGTPGMGRVVLEAGADYVAWPMGRLRRLLDRNPSLDRALRAVVVQDTAAKMDVYVRRAALLKRGIDPDAQPAGAAPPPEGAQLLLIEDHPAADRA